MTPRPIGILLDLAKCRGCRRCVTACQRAHGFPETSGGGEELGPRALTAVRKGDDSWVRTMCRHCLSPACVSACIVGALKKSPLGPVGYEADKCIGCRYCMLACPFNVPKYEWDSANPKVQKCDLCLPEVERGRSPACAKACPHDATVFGPREELVAEAHRRIEAEPSVYHDHVYGEAELGGTSVMFIAPAPVAALGYRPELGERPLPDITAEALLRVPWIALCGTATLAGLWWILRRRDEVALARSAAGRAAHERLRRDAGASTREVGHEGR